MEIFVDIFSEIGCPRSQIYLLLDNKPSVIPWLYVTNYFFIFHCKNWYYKLSFSIRFILHCKADKARARNIRHFELYTTALGLVSVRNNKPYSFSKYFEILKYMTLVMT